MEKQILAETKTSKSTPAKVSTESLDSRIERLKTFMDTFDPYQPISTADQETLKSYNIYDLGDPFKITNELIFLIEELIEKRQK